MQLPMSEVAVLVIDMLNTYRARGRRSCWCPTSPNIVDPLAGLISRARDRDDVDVIYVNDNYGDFTADFDDIVNAALDGERPDLVSADRARRGLPAGAQSASQRVLRQLAGLSARAGWRPSD